MNHTGKKGRTGSQRLLQMAVNENPGLLDQALRESGALKPSETVSWTSPLRAEKYKEYRDKAALVKIGLTDPLNFPLTEFWPKGGPVWDATGITNTGRPVLVEAKAHIPEAASPACAASPKSLSRIKSGLEAARKYYAPKSTSSWTDIFYQYANRLAFHYFLQHLNGIPSILVFLYFLNARDMNGPSSTLEWEGAIRLLHAVLGLPPSLKKFDVYHAYVDARQLKVNT